MILLVASNKDIASQNIKAQILSHYSFRKATQDFQGNLAYGAEINEKQVGLVTLNDESVYAQNLVHSFSHLELIVFISRHSSESRKPTLSVHTPGNLAEAELGGIPRRVSISPANAMRTALEAMTQLKNKMMLDYEVSYEGTHHGPSLDVPTMFAELGSSITQWSDKKAAEAVALSAMEAVSRFGDYPVDAVLGIGGLHYNTKFSQMALESKVAFGHMIPKYAIPKMDSATVRQCIEKTLEHVDHVVLDWKGIRGEDKPSVIGMLEEIGIPFEKV